MMTAATPTMTSTASAALWPQVQKFMLRHTGNVLRDDQTYLLESRLQRAIKPLGFSCVADLVAAACVAQPKPEHAAALIQALTTHETSFFRDINFWQQLRSVVLPELAAKTASGRRIRIWCAACSTGQEPYSLAMLIHELDAAQIDRYEIIASDIAAATLQQAQDGFYTSLETNRGLDLKHLARFFTQAPGGFRVKDALRKAIRFQQHNLLGANADPAECDLVLCRNVLIYFSETDRNLVLKRLTRAVAAAGLFALGSTESCREAGLQPMTAGLYRKSNI